MTCTREIMARLAVPTLTLLWRRAEDYSLRLVWEVWPVEDGVRIDTRSPIDPLGGRRAIVRLKAQ